MGDPVLPVPVDPSGGLVHRVQRQVPEEIGHVVVFREPHVLDLVCARMHLDRDPPKVERELERAAGVRPVMVEVRVPDPGHHRLEVLAAARSGLPLRHGKVGAACGSDVAVAPRLGADPLLGIVAVLDLEPEWIPLARRVPAAAHVLAYRRIPAGREVHAILHHVLVVVVVWSPDQDRGRWPVNVGQVDVCGELDPVSHGDIHPEHHLHTVESH